jgi:hypothetical protein
MMGVELVPVYSENEMKDKIFVGGRENFSGMFYGINPVLACKRYRILGCMFLKPEDLENVKVSSLLSLVANTGLGLIS